MDSKTREGLIRMLQAVDATAQKLEEARPLDPYTVVGYVLYNGQLRCMDCAPVLRGPADATPVYIDSNPHALENCDQCNRMLNEGAS